jgi:hypothetical protein
MNVVEPRLPETPDGIVRFVDAEFKLGRQGGVAPLLRPAQGKLERHENVLRFELHTI